MNAVRQVWVRAALAAMLVAGCETTFEMAEPMNGVGGSSSTPPPSIGSTGGSGSGAGVGAPPASGAAGAAAAGGASGSASAQAGTGGSAPPQAGSAGDPIAIGGSGSAGMEGTAGAGGAQAPMMQTCPATSTLVPGETTATVTVGASQRRYILHVPASYTGQTPVPLVLDFHGILMSSSLERAFSGFADLSETKGFIVAFPEGTDTAFNVGICCTSSGAIDDVAFARAIVAQLSEQGCIDQKRIHSVGYSMGGGMSMKLACDAADMIASIAYSAFDMMPDADWPCAPSRPVPALAFRSTGDPIVPYGGAVDTIPPNGNPNLVTFIGAEANLNKWAMIDGCTGSVETSGNCQYYRQCSSGAEVGLCTKSGGGHDYMDAAPAWAFLEQHPMP